MELLLYRMECESVHVISPLNGACEQNVSLTPWSLDLRFCMKVSVLVGKGDLSLVSNRFRGVSSLTHIDV